MVKRNSHFERPMQKSSSSRYKNWPKNEIFSKTCIPSETSFFIRLDGWRFRKLSETIKAEKLFDEKFVKCLVSSGKVLFKKGFHPTLIYVASDELNILFTDTAPFRGRIEKTNSIMAGLVSSAYSLNLQKFFNKKQIAAFDSRVVIASNVEKIMAYLSWRQMNTWRNHNNAYGYWILRKTGYKPTEIAKKLKGIKAKKFHEMMFKQSVNLAKTPQWQRRGILIHKEPILKRANNGLVERWRLKKDWNLPVFTSENGARLVQRILEWTKQKRKK
jgi:tRNA(His) guanylyltransferase